MYMYRVHNVDYCQEGSVLMGGGEDQMSHFPTEAMDYQRPYPFGLDPVSVARHDTAACHLKSSLSSAVAGGRE